MKTYLLLGILICGIFPGFANASGTDCTLNLWTYGHFYDSKCIFHNWWLYSKIYVDGERVGNVNYHHTISWASGKEIKVEVKSEDYVSESMTFRCQAGETINKEVHLQFDGCFVEVHALGVPVFNQVVEITSKTKLYLDKKYVNVLDLYYRCLGITLGKHTFLARRWGFKSGSEEVTCSERDTKLPDVILHLEKSKTYCSPRIIVYSDSFMRNGKRKQVYADLYVDDLNHGSVKNRVIRFEAGKTYTFQAKIEGYASDPYTFVCNEKERETVKLILKKI